MAAWPHLRHRALCDLGGLWSKVAPVRPTLRCTRLATAGFARFRERVNSNVSPQLEIQSRAMPHGARTTEHCQDRARALSHELSTEHAAVSWCELDGPRVWQLRLNHRLWQSPGMH